MANSRKPQLPVEAVLEKGTEREDGRVYLWSDPGPGQVVHLSEEREMVLPVMTRCGWHAGPLWRMSVLQPEMTVLCMECHLG